MGEAIVTVGQTLVIHLSEGLASLLLLLDLVFELCDIQKQSLDLC